jgi:hypothetical protein
MEADMGRSEPQFCRDQAERLLKLAKECDDPKCETTFASWHVSGWNGQRQKTSWEIGTCPKQLNGLDFQQYFQPEAYRDRELRHLLVPREK